MGIWVLLQPRWEITCGPHKLDPISFLSQASKQASIDKDNKKAVGMLDFIHENEIYYILETYINN